MYYDRIARGIGTYNTDDVLSGREPENGVVKPQIIMLEQTATL